MSTFDKGSISVFTKEEAIASVADNWRHQYGEDGNGYGGKMVEILHRLIREKPTTEGAVTEIIGNDTWTAMSCDVCGEDTDKLVSIRTRWGGESGCSICVGCVEEAHNLAHKQEPR